MKKSFLIPILVTHLTACVPASQRRADIQVAYRKGFQVGRVVGRDDVLLSLKSPDCFFQKVDTLMASEKDTDAGWKIGGTKK